MVEEALIYTHHEALTDTNVAQWTGLEQVRNSKIRNLIQFLHLSLDLFERSLQSQFIEFGPTMQKNLEKLQLRIGKIIKKKESTLLAAFMPQERAMNDNVPPENLLQSLDTRTDFYNLGNLQELQSVCPLLC